MSDEIAFETKDGKVVYYNGHLPVFVHDKGDLATFRFFTSQLTVNGNASQAQALLDQGIAVPEAARHPAQHASQGHSRWSHARGHKKRFKRSAGGVLQ